MKTRKRRMEFFHFYDHTGMEQHLENMASKGWILEKIGNVSWVYRREEPQKVRVSVSYDSKNSEYDPVMGEEEMERVELCQHTGWKRMARSSQLQVFYNWEEDPLPMETDPEMEVSAIHRAAKRSYLPMFGAWLGIAVVYLSIFISELTGDVVQALSDTSVLVRGFLGLAVMVWAGSELLGYLRWYHKAEALAQQGVFLPTSGKNIVGKAAFGFAIVTLLLYWVDLMVQDNPGIRVGAICLAVLILVHWVLIPQLTQLMRNNGVAKQTNARVTAGATLAASVLIIGMMSVIVIGKGWYLYGSESGMAQYIEQPPLTIQQLLGEDEQRYYHREWREESPLVGRYERMELQQWDLMEDDVDAPELIYTLVQVYASPLYSLCRDDYLEKEHRAIDAQPWLADEAYQYMDGDRPLSGYLLCYPDRLVELTLTWKPTEEQMTLVGETLGGI